MTRTDIRIGEGAVEREGVGGVGGRESGMGMGGGRDRQTDE